MTKIYTQEQYFEKLNKIKVDQNWASRKSRFTIFVGAGFSQNFEMPGWEDYAVKKLDLLSKDKNLNLNFTTKEELKKLDKKHLLTLIDSYLDSNDDKKKYEKKIFETDKNKVNEYHEKNKDFCDSFTKINASFVTTNYDNVLEDYFGFVKQESFNSDNIYILNPGDVFHIHGDINALDNQNFLICTWKDYYELYYKVPNNSQFKQRYIEMINEFLECLFAKNEILIIGYSLSEIELLKYIFKQNKIEKEESNITILVLKREKSDEDVLHKLYGALGLNIICLDIDIDGYGVIFSFLEKLSNEFRRDELVYDEDIL